MCACQRSIECWYSHAFSCFFLSFLPIIGQLHSEPHWTVCKAGTSYPIMSWSNCHLTYCSRCGSSTFLLHFSLYLIFRSLFSIHLTPLWAPVPSPLPTQQVCGGRWGGLSACSCVCWSCAQLPVHHGAGRECVPPIRAAFYCLCGQSPRNGELQFLFLQMLVFAPVPSRSGNLLLF